MRSLFLQFQLKNLLPTASHSPKLVAAKMAKTASTLILQPKTSHLGLPLLPVVISVSTLHQDADLDPQVLTPELTTKKLRCPAISSNGVPADKEQLASSLMLLRKQP